MRYKYNTVRQKQWPMFFGDYRTFRKVYANQGIAQVIETKKIHMKESTVTEVPRYAVERRGREKNLKGLRQ